MHGNIVRSYLYNILFIICLCRVSSDIMLILFPEVIPCQKYHMTMILVQRVRES